MNKAPTMKDVAREAGVALGTVSKVFNGIPVGKRYKQKVDEASARLGYSLNSYARGLRANRTYTVALILPYINHPFFSALADSVCSELARRDYRLLLATTQSSPQGEAQCIQMVRQNKVDGIIGLTYSPDLAINDDIPYVSIDRCISPGIPCVSSDNFNGGAIAAAKLLELGCKKLLFLRIGSSIIGETDKRGAGFAAACDIRGADYSAQRFDDAEGNEAVYRFLDAHIRDGRLEYDGIFCNTDRLAFFVIDHLASHGVAVPEDVQVIGYDGARKFQTEGYFCSTIVQPVEQMAATAVDILLSRDRSQNPALVCLPVYYAPGGTTREPVAPKTVEGKDSARADEGEESAHAVQGKDSSRTVEGKDSSCADEGMNSAGAVEEKDSSCAVEGMNSTRADEGKDSARAVQGKDSSCAVEGMNSVHADEGKDSACADEGMNSACAVEAAGSSRADEGMNSARAVEAVAVMERL